VLPLIRCFVGTVVNEDLSELSAVMPSYLRSGGLPVMRLVRSAVKDRPEDFIGGLQLRTLVLTGEHDRFSPPEWAQHLAELALAVASRYRGRITPALPSPPRQTPLFTRPYSPGRVAIPSRRWCGSVTPP
jgi:hypothetical protein